MTTAPFPERRYLTGEIREEHVKEVVRLYEEGASIRKLMSQTGRSYGAIHRALIEGGAQMRAKGGLRERSHSARKIREEYVKIREQYVKIREERVREIVRLYEGGASVQELMSQTGRSYWTVRRALTKGGAQMRVKSGPREHYLTGEIREEHVKEMVRLYEEGALIRELMSQTGRSYGAIHRALIEGGAQMRPKGRRPQ